MNDQYRVEPAGPLQRLPEIEETPIGQTELFGDLEPDTASALLTSRFVVPPFSVLDTRAGYWQERKAQWLALGIQSELGRGEIDSGFQGANYGGVMADYSASVRHAGGYSSSNATGGRQKASALGAGGKVPSRAEIEAKRASRLSPRKAADARSNLTGAQALPEYATNGTELIAPGTSIFDPVLCEIAYRWFAPPDGSVLDPFAGGSVRGIVAAMLGHRYTGLDLSEAQVLANRAQADDLLAGGDYPPPIWIQGDSARMAQILTEPMKYDLLFSCPPYYDLEVYGDEEGELSAMPSYEEFLRAYRLIIALACERLKEDRFAVWIVGEIRGADGFQRGFVADTIQAFRDAGLHLQNEAVLINAVGTLALRAPRMFLSSRALGRSHQSVLVFWKGSRKPAWKEING